MNSAEFYSEIAWCFCMFRMWCMMIPGVLVA